MIENPELSLCEIVDAGCDWLTITCRHGVSLPTLLEIWEELVCEAEKLGHPVEKVKTSRYTGYECGGIYILGRPSDMMFEARGAVANRALSAMKGVCWNGNVPRADWQVTYRGAPEVVKDAEQRCDELRGLETGSEAHGKVFMELKRPPKSTPTLYLGAPRSDSRVRIYCAGARHPDRYQADAQRDEFQARDDVARHTYKCAQNAASVTCFAASIVMGRLMQWDVSQPWYGQTVPVKPISGWKKTSDESFFEWWLKCVAPRMKAMMDRGYRQSFADGLNVEALESIPIPDLNAMQANQMSDAYRIGVISGQKAYFDREKKIALISPSHSKDTKGKTLKKGGLD